MSANICIGDRVMVVRTTPCCCNTHGMWGVGIVKDLVVATSQCHWCHKLTHGKIAKVNFEEHFTWHDPRRLMRLDDFTPSADDTDAIKHYSEGRGVSMPAFVRGKT